MDEFHSSQKSCVSAVNQQRRKLRDFQESLKRCVILLYFHKFFSMALHIHMFWSQLIIIVFIISLCTCRQIWHH